MNSNNQYPHGGLMFVCLMNFVYYQVFKSLSNIQSKCFTFLIYAWENGIRQILGQYKHGDDIHEQRKQENQWNTKFVSNLLWRLGLKIFNKNNA